jgi:hypothetical protein
MLSTPDDRFYRGQLVTLRVATSGDDCEGTFQEVPSGATGTIDEIAVYPWPQGVSVTVVIDTGKRDANGETLTIVNVFDEDGGPLTDFLI